jgi:cytochrome P450
MEATIHETLRISSGQAFSLPHRAMADCTLNGYHIPKNTTVVINLNAIHMNKEFYEDPWTFQPERFLNQEGKLSIPDHFIPFGVGKE